MLAPAWIMTGQQLPERTGMVHMYRMAQFVQHDSFGKMARQKKQFSVERYRSLRRTASPAGSLKSDSCLFEPEIVFMRKSVQHGHKNPGSLSDNPESKSRTAKPDIRRIASQNNVSSRTLDQRNITRSRIPLTAHQPLLSAALESNRVRKNRNIRTIRKQAVTAHFFAGSNDPLPMPKNDIVDTLLVIMSRHYNNQPLIRNHFQAGIARFPAIPYRKYKTRQKAALLANATLE